MLQVAAVSTDNSKRCLRQFNTSIICDKSLIHIFSGSLDDFEDKIPLKKTPEFYINSHETFNHLTFKKKFIKRYLRNRLNKTLSKNYKKQFYCEDGCLN